MKEFTPRKTITIRSKGSDITSLAQALDNDFTKEEIKKILESFTKLFSTCHIVSSTMILSERVPELIAKSATKKSELTLMLAILLSSREIVEVKLAELPESVIEIYRSVYRDIYMTVRKAEEKFGRTITVKRKNSGWSYYYSSSSGLELVPIFSMLKCDSLGSWSGQNVYLVMPQSIRRVLGPLLVPASLDVPVLSEYIPAKGETLYSVQTEVEPLYPVLHTLYINGILEMGKTKVTATTLKRISRQASFREFFPDTKIKSLKNLAGTLITSLFCLNASNSLTGRKAMPEPVNRVARNIIGFMRNSTAGVINFFAGILLTKSYQTVFSLPSCSLLIKTCLDMLSTYAADNWLTARGLMAALRNSPDSQTLLIPFNVIQLSNYSISNQFSYKYLTPANVINEFTRPVVELLTASLAALGMAEIIYSEPDDDPSPMWGLKAVRLTPLGRYALGLTDDYVSGLAENGPFFEFDSERLLVQTIGENNPYENILSKYLIPVGEHRFRVTDESFLGDCDSSQDLERKIANFRLLTGESLPPVWETFFSDIKRKCGAFTPVEDKYQIYTVNPDDSELVAAISDDPVLKGLTICAEGFMLLVRRTDLDKFRAAMRKYGYII